MAPAKSPRFRVERDTLGEVSVPRDALYGAQTQRAVENFPVSGLRSHPAFIRAFILIKKAAAISNHELGALDRKTAAAISDAADQILGSESTISFSRALAASRRRHDVRGSRTREDDVRAVPWLVPPHYIAPEHRGEFVVDVFQAGAGTSFNMNCNEVLANLANRALGAKPGSNAPIHPNDHVNMSQSTNDTFPTATRLATLLLLRELFPALDGLAFALDRKGEEFADVIKSGRTHLQDAVPVTLGQEFAAWGAAVRRASDLLEAAAGQLRLLGIGGTATGTGINTPAGFRHQIVRNLSIATGLELESQADLREAMQSQLPVGAVMSALRSLALELTRITNDIRLLASGPLTGLGELILPAVQPGSSIMPGKVNPSMLECMNQVCFHVIGAAAAVDYAMQAGQLELNVMMPLMAFEALFSIEILKNFVPVFVDRCITGIDADREQSEAYYISSPALATALNPLIGYARAAEVAKEAAKTRRPIPDLLRERKLIPEKQIREIFSPGFLTGQAEAEPSATSAKGKPSPGKRPAKRR
jgi:aspartate ammonia-lyase